MKIITALLALMLIASVAFAEELMIADFDKGEKPNNLQGDFGGWSKDPTDAKGICIESFDAVNKVGEKGFGMKLDYDVSSAKGTYNGFWMQLNNLDASKYTTLSFVVKGDKSGYTTAAKIEIKNSKGQVGKTYITDIKEEWQQVDIPLKDMKGLTDTTSLTEFVVVFESNIASNKKGIIYIDNIKFVKE